MLNKLLNFVFLEGPVGTVDGLLPISQCVGWWLLVLLVVGCVAVPPSAGIAVRRPVVSGQQRIYERLNFLFAQFSIVLVKVVLTKATALVTSCVIRKTRIGLGGVLITVSG